MNHSQMLMLLLISHNYQNPFIPLLACYFDNFLLEQYGSDDVDVSRGLRLVVFSRFDGADIDPEIDALLIGQHDAAGMPPSDIFLYNNTGCQTTGFHDDAVWLQDRVKRPRQRQTSEETNQTTKRVVQVASSTTKQRTCRAYEKNFAKRRYEASLYENRESF